MNIARFVSSVLVVVLVFVVASCARETPPPDLPSWKAGATREAIIAYVEKVTNPLGGQFIRRDERIAVFDNDGTLWAEQPVYFQLLFSIDRVHALQDQHPEWQETEPFRSILAGDLSGVMAAGEAGLVQLVLATHTGMTRSEYAESVLEWMETARHPTTGRRYSDMVYQPMLELLDYLRDNGFRTYIASGGGIEFMRPWVEGTYGIPPEQVIGSSMATVFEERDGTPVLFRQPEINFVNDGPGKPVGINQHIGRQPVAGFGNSDGDLEMLKWVDASPHRSLQVIVHHTDAEREWAYDSPSSIGHLEEAMIVAEERGWTVVDMARDWTTIFPPEN